MKKIFLLLFVLIGSIFVGSSVMAESELNCTAVYAPVCGEVGPDCEIDSDGYTTCSDVEPWQETFSNSCELSKAGAEFLHRGVCGEDEIIGEPPIEVCSTVYEPVCAQAPMPICPEGMFCPQVTPIPKTYGNSCKAGLDKALVLYEGVCEGDREEVSVDIWIDDIEIDNPEDHDIVDGNDLQIEANIETQGLSRGTRIYSQVSVYDANGRFIDSCGSHGTVDTPVGDNMRGNADFSCGVDDFPASGKYRFEVFSDARNQIAEYNESNNKKQITVAIGSIETELSITLQRKINDILERLYAKLDIRYDDDNEEKIDYLENVLDRLEYISDRKPQHRVLIAYILDHINNQIDQYSDDINEIFNIFN